MKPEFDKLKADILGISFDTEKDNAAFAAKFDFNFPLLCDTDRKVGIAYSACSSSEAGFAKRISYCIGPDGKILYAYDQVKPAEHPAQVLEDLRKPHPAGM